MQLKHVSPWAARGQKREEALEYTVVLSSPYLYPSLSKICFLMYSLLQSVLLLLTSQTQLQKITPVQGTSYFPAYQSVLDMYDTHTAKKSLKHPLQTFHHLFLKIKWEKKMLLLESKVFWARIQSSMNSTKFKVIWYIELTVF